MKQRKWGWMAGILFSVMGIAGYGQDPWKPEQLMATDKLAGIINNASAAKPVIYNIGPSGKIKGAVDIGSTGEANNLKKLKTALAGLPRNTEVVIYCGCCPFANCPNIRPAFQLLQQMQFTRFYLLNIPRNLRVDWITKGYPMAGTAQ